MTAIQVEGLVKSFGSVRALDGLDLAVESGEIHGFLGPNGAGKTTTIRVLLGLVRASGGSAKLLGGDPWSEAVRLHRRVSYVPGDVALWPNLTGGEAIDVIGRARGGLNEKRRAELIERFDLDTTKKSRTYSKGNRQKVAIVAGLAADADLLILDEPTSGLDPLMEVTFQQVVRELNAEGRTVLLSSHILAQVEALADKVTIIRLGKTVESGTLQQLRHLTRTSISVETERSPAGLESRAGVHDVTSDDGRLHFDVDGEHLDAVIGYLSSLGIRSLISRPPTLEQLFLRHYGAEDETASAGASEAAEEPAR